MKKIFTIFILLSFIGLSNYVNSQITSVSIQHISTIPIIGENPIVSYKTINNKIYLFGLRTPPYIGNWVASNRTRTFDIASNTWDSLSSILPYGIWDSNIASYFNNHFYFGPGFADGGNYGLGSHNKMIDVDLINNTAQETSNQFSSGSIWNIGSIEVNSKLYFFCGWNGSAVNSIFEYNPTSSTFQQVASFAYARSQVRAILGNDGWIYVLSKNTNYSIERFNPVNYQVQTMAATLPINAMIINYWHIPLENSIYFFNYDINPTVYKYNYSTDVVSNTGIILNGSFSQQNTLDSNDPYSIYGFKYNPDNTAPLQLVKMTLSPLVGITENTNQQLNIYPNPVSNQLQVQTDATIKIIQITDVTGRLLISTNQKTIDCSRLAKGVYFIKLETEKGVAVKKFMKE